MSAPATPTMREQLAAQFPNLAVKDESGQTVRFFDGLIRDRVVIINFMFTTCDGQCPRTTAKLVRVRTALGERFGRDISFVSVSVDPGVDTPEQLRAYMDRYDIPRGRGWRFITGSAEDLQRIRERLGFRDREKMDHTGVLIVGNEPTGTWTMLPSLASAESIATAIALAADSGGILGPAKKPAQARTDAP